MRTYEKDGKPVIVCECGFKLYEDGVLKMRVALVEGGYICPKCPRCKRFSESFPINLLLK